MNDEINSFPKRSRRNALKPSSLEYNVLQDFSLERCLNNTSITLKKPRTEQLHDESICDTKQNIQNISKSIENKNNVIDLDNIQKTHEVVNEIISNIVDIIELSYNKS